MEALRKSDYNYYLPEELIAQVPAEKRDYLFLTGKRTLTNPATFAT